MASQAVIGVLLAVEAIILAKISDGIDCFLRHQKRRAGK
jgi:hypothetical protein